MARRWRISPCTGITLRRVDDVVEVEQLAGGGVPGDVHHGVALVHDVGAPARQAVDDAVDGVLVAGDQRGREDHGVALAEHDAVVTAGHPRQRRHRLALRAGADEHDLVVGEVVELLDVDDGVGRGSSGSRGRGRSPMLRTIDRPTNATLRPCSRGDVEDLLDAVDVGRERGHDDPALGVWAKHPVEHRDDVLLGRDEAGHLGVGGVDQEQVDALLAEPGEAPAGR